MSLARIIRTKTIRADFRVCCNHKTSKVACTETLNAIRRTFNNIVEIQAVKPYDKTEDMCVIGTAIIRPSMRSRFEKDLKVKINKNNSIKIKKSIVTLYK